jgi:hypothetical protein
MKIAKMLGIAVFASLALMASVGVASAFALQVKSCENNTAATCKKASVGTTFSAEGTNIKLSNGFLTNTCTGKLSGSVTDPESTEAKDLITASISSAAFEPCNLAKVTVAGLPWTLETNSAEFPKGKVTGVHVTLAVPFVGNCTFAEDATHTITGTWTNGSGTTKSSITLGGTMVKTEGPSGCGSEGSISGTVTLTKVSDPNNTKANNLRIE